MKPFVLIASVALLSAVAGASAPGSAPPFAFLEPTVRVSHTDRARLDTGDVIARVRVESEGPALMRGVTRRLEGRRPGPEGAES